MTGQDLIREAARRYPIGSRFVDLVHGETFTVKSHSFDSFGTDGQLYIPVEQHPVKPNKTARIYRSGKWAEVVDGDITDKIKSAQKSKMGTIQEECKKRFPIGCEYVCANSGSRLTLLSDAVTYSIEEEEIWAHSGGGYLYSDGKFARHVGGVVQNSSMEQVQEECKRRFPIGCEYVGVGAGKYTLIRDDYTYSIHGDDIWAHSGGGVLYKEGKYATIFTEDSGIKCSEIELPTEHTVMAFESAGSINSPIASTRIEEVSFKRIGAMSKNKVQLDKLIEEVSFKRIKCK